jgi:hypothetical protein
MGIEKRKLGKTEVDVTKLGLGRDIHISMS